MKKNNELECHDICVDGEFETNMCDPHEIITYLEIYFDVDKKFDLNINDEDGTWLNMYAIFNPFEDTLKIKCIISREDNEEGFNYTPSESEASLIKQLITEKVYADCGLSPKEYCNQFIDNGQTMGGM